MGWNIGYIKLVYDNRGTLTQTTITKAFMITQDKHINLARS